MSLQELGGWEDCHRGSKVLTAGHRLQEYNIKNMKNYILC